MNERSTKLLSGLFAVIVMTVATGSIFAQPRESRGRNLTKSQVKVIIDRVETRVDYFVKEFDKSLDRSKLNGSNREDGLNKRAKELEKATDELRHKFDTTDAWIDNKEGVRKCLRIASEIDPSVRNNRFGGATETNWSKARYELNSLADVYNLPRVGAAVYN